MKRRRYRVGEGKLDPRQPGEIRALTTFYLSHGTLALLRALAQKLDVSMTIVLEIIIRKAAEQQGLQYRDPISHTNPRSSRSTLISKSGGRKVA